MHASFDKRVNPSSYRKLTRGVATIPADGGFAPMRAICPHISAPIRTLE